MGRKLLHLLNGLITCAVTLSLVIAGAYAGYALWDNQRIYDTAENVYSEMKEIKAAMGMPTTLSAMEELLEENRKAREAKAAEEAMAAEAAQAAAEIPAMQEAPAEPEKPADAEPAQEATPKAGTPVTAEAAENPGIPETGTDVRAEVPATEKTEAPEAPAAVLVTFEPAATSAPAATPAPTTIPAPTEEPIDPLLAQLRTINPEISAWLTLPGTAIDYPVMQGSSNYSYINTDVYGNFALAGSIFLDYRNEKDYTDLYSLLYGHNMSQHRMFSDINLYKEEDFFKENTLGMMLTKDGWHILESLSVIVTPASNSSLMNPGNWDYLDGEEIYKLVQEDALFTCEEGLKSLREQIEDEEATPRLVALSTCSDEFTDARTILLTLMDP